MSRALNVDATIPQVVAMARKHDVAISAIEALEPHGTRVVMVTGDAAAVLTRAYLKQICVDGFWHSDPHPGNIFVREVDGEPQIVLLDFGMAASISHEFQDEIIKLLLAISSNRGATRCASALA